jgi:myotubularin-related protein 9
MSQHLNCLYLPHKAIIWPSVAPMSLGLWSGYFLRWVQSSALAATGQERRRMGEIVERNKQAQAAAHKLRRELKELMEEAAKLGLIDTGEEVEAKEVIDGQEKIEVVKSHPLEA